MNSFYRGEEERRSNYDVVHSRLMMIQRTLDRNPPETSGTTDSLRTAALRSIREYEEFPIEIKKRLGFDVAVLRRRLESLSCSN